MSATATAPRGLARIRLFLFLVAAEQAAVAVVVVPTLTPLRAAVAAIGLGLGIAASVLAAWLLGRGRSWPITMAAAGVLCALLQAGVMLGDSHEPAYALLGIVALLAIGPLLSPELGAWARATKSPPAWAQLPLIAMLVAGFVLPPYAASLHDPTQVGPEAMQLSLTCQVAATADFQVVTAHVEFRWLRTDLLPAGLAGIEDARDLVSTSAQPGSTLHIWEDSGTLPGGGYLIPLASGAIPWGNAIANGPLDMTLNGRPTRAGFGQAIDADSPSNSSNLLATLGRTRARQLAVRWNAIEAGSLYAATWSFEAAADEELPFLVVEYNHLGRMRFQAGADCSHPSVAYPTRYQVHNSSY